MLDKLRAKEAADKRAPASRRADRAQVAIFLWRTFGILFFLGSVAAWLLYNNGIALFLLALSIGSVIMIVVTLARNADELTEAMHAELARGLVYHDKLYRTQGNKVEDKVYQYCELVSQQEGLLQEHYEYANCLLQITEGHYTGDTENQLASYRDFMQSTYNLRR